MALLASERVTKSLQRKSHGLADPYEVPISPPKKRSTLKERHVPCPMQRLKTYGQKRLKPALRPGGQLENRTLKYRQTQGDSARIYEYGCGEQPAKRQKSLRDEAQTNPEVEESVFGTESALDDITERTRNELMGKALEALFAVGEGSSMAETATAPAGKNRRVTREANISSEKGASTATVRGASNTAAVTVEKHNRSEAPKSALDHETDVDMLEEEPLANSVSILESGMSPSEDLAIVEVDEVNRVDTSTLPNIELPIDNRFSERGERNVDLAVRASVPYPASLFLDTAMDIETESNAVNHLSEGFGTAIDVEIENPAVSYMSGGFDTDVIETEASNNNAGTGRCSIESIQGFQMDETVSRTFHTTSVTGVGADHFKIGPCRISCKMGRSRRRVYDLAI